MMIQYLLRSVWFVSDGTGYSTVLYILYTIDFCGDVAVMRR